MRLNVNISVEKKGKIETGSYGMGGRYMYDNLFFEKLEIAVDSAYNQVVLKLSSKPLQQVNKRLF